MKLQWDQRLNKDKTRKAVAELSRKAKKSLLVMPSNTGRDVELLLQQDVPDSKAKWYVVERDKEKLAQFKKCRLLQLRATKYFPQELSEVRLTTELDFAWFDLCGNLTKPLVLWLKNLKYAAHADLFFTFSLAPTRGNQFFRDLADNLSHSFTLPLKKLMVEHSSQIEAANIDRSYLLPILIQSILLNYIFPASETSCYFYQDTVPMVLFHLKQFGPKQHSDIDHFITAMLEGDDLASRIVNAKTKKELRQIKVEVEKIAAKMPDSIKFKNNIKDLVVRKQQSRTLEIFD